MWLPDLSSTCSRLALDLLSTIARLSLDYPDFFDSTVSVRQTINLCGRAIRQCNRRAHDEAFIGVADGIYVYRARIEAASYCISTDALRISAIVIVLRSVELPCHKRIDACAEYGNFNNISNTCANCHVSFPLTAPSVAPVYIASMKRSISFSVL